MFLWFWLPDSELGSYFCLKVFNLPIQPRKITLVIREFDLGKQKDIYNNTGGTFAELQEFFTDCP